MSATCSAVYNVFTAVPSILPDLRSSLAFGRGAAFLAVLILGLAGWTGIYRLVRAEFLKHVVRDYVRSAEAIGAGNRRSMFRHILPNVSHVILVQLSIPVVAFIKSEVIPAPVSASASASTRRRERRSPAKSDLILGHWWQLAAATIFAAVFVTAFSPFMTDALRRPFRSWASSGGSNERLPSKRCEQQAAPLPSTVVDPVSSSAGFGKMGVMRRVDAVKGVSFELPENTTVALVSRRVGSGKSVTAMSILNLLPDNASERSGATTFQGQHDLLSKALAGRAAARLRDAIARLQDLKELLNLGVYASASRSPSRREGSGWSGGEAGDRPRRGAACRGRQCRSRSGLPAPAPGGCAAS